MKQLIIAGIILCIAAPAGAEVGEAYKKLTGARSLKCVFHNGSAGDFRSGKVEVKTLKEEMSLHFDAIDLESGKARSIGNQGTSNETVLVTPTGVTFIEQTNSGNLVVTTVFAIYDVRKEFIAVESRHMDFFGVAIPSQYYGTCSVWPSQ